MPRLRLAGDEVFAPELPLETIERAPTLDAAVALVATQWDFRAHPYFAWMAATTTTREQFRRTQAPFRFAVEAFAQPLAALVARIAAPELRAGVARNLDDEHGHGNELKTHKATFLQYLRALGTTPAELEPPCPTAVRAFNEALLSFCLSHPAPAGAALVGVIEHVYVGIAARIAVTVRERGWCAPGSQHHYEVHEELDVGHAQDLLAVARPGWEHGDPALRREIALGLSLGAHWFWTLYAELLAAR